MATRFFFYDQKYFLLIAYIQEINLRSIKIENCKNMKNPLIVLLFVPFDFKNILLKNFSIYDVHVHNITQDISYPL